MIAERGRAVLTAPGARRRLGKRHRRRSACHSDDPRRPAGEAVRGGRTTGRYSPSGRVVGGGRDGAARPPVGPRPCARPPDLPREHTTYIAAPFCSLCGRCRSGQAGSSVSPAGSSAAPSRSAAASAASNESNASATRQLSPRAVTSTSAPSARPSVSPTRTAAAS
jgi:hypothetical protein